MRKLAGSLVLVACLMFSMSPGFTTATPDKKAGVLMVGFGEPGRYDANAEVAWKNFLLNYMSSGMRMLHMSFMYPLVLGMMIPMMDVGTLLVDKDEPFAQNSKPNPNLIDAWGNPYQGKDYRWISIPEGGFPMLGPLFSYYLVQDGPGKGEPDFWEYVGLCMYGFYQYMGNYNPGEERELRIMDETEASLRERYGNDILIERGFGAARPGYPGFRQVAEKMVREEGVTDLILAEAYVCFSEFEHPVTDIEEYLNKKGLDVNIVIAGQIGGTEPFNLGVANKVSEELKDIPQGSDVVVFLSHHGMFNLNMLLYDWSKEPYHQYARAAFDGASQAIYELDAVEGWKGKFDVWQVYAEFVEGLMDPQDEIMSVGEAVDKASAQGYQYCINVPYEVGNSGFETLMGLRGCWGVDPPTWEEYYEDGLKKYRTSIEHGGMKVVITDGWIDGASDGYYQQISKAVDGIQGGLI